MGSLGVGRGRPRSSHNNVQVKVQSDIHTSTHIYKLVVVRVIIAKPKYSVWRGSNTKLIQKYGRVKVPNDIYTSGVLEHKRRASLPC